MDFFYIAVLTILDASNNPFEEGYSSKCKEDAEMFRRSRISHWEDMGYKVLKSRIGKRRVRKNNPTFGREKKAGLI